MRPSLLHRVVVEAMFCAASNISEAAQALEDGARTLGNQLGANLTHAAHHSSPHRMVRALGEGVRSLGNRPDERLVVHTHVDLTGRRALPPPSPPPSPSPMASSTTGESLEDAIGRAILVRAVTLIAQACDMLVLKRLETRRLAALRAERRGKHRSPTCCSQGDIISVRPSQHTAAT